MTLDSYTGVEGYGRWNQQLNDRFQPPGNPYSIVPPSGAITEPMLYQTDQMAREAINQALGQCAEEDRKIKASILGIRESVDKVKDAAATNSSQIGAAEESTREERHQQSQDYKRIAHEEARCRDAVEQGERLEQQRVSQHLQRWGRYEAEFRGSMDVIQLRIRNLVTAIEKIENKRKKS